MASTCVSPTEPVANGGCEDYEVEIPELPSDLPELEIPEIGVVTTEAVDGTGVFDIYMRAGMNQLDSQYKAGRIKGADYAAAYIAMTELMMTQSNKFVIDKYTAELQSIQAQIAIELYKLQYLSAGYEAALKKSQAEKAKFESDLICQQIAELKLNGQSKRSLETAQEAVACSQKDLYIEQASSFNKKSANETLKTMSNMWAVYIAEIDNDALASPTNIIGNDMEVTIESMKGKVGLI